MNKRQRKKADKKLRKKISDAMFLYFHGCNRCDKQCKAHK
jgi:hypothetical protein